MKFIVRLLIVASCFAAVVRAEKPEWVGAKVQILNTGHIYTSINRTDSFAWPSEEIREVSGSSGWRKRGWSPEVGDIGVVTMMDKTEFRCLVKVADYYVPIAPKALKRLGDDADVPKTLADLLKLRKKRDALHTAIRNGDLQAASRLIAAGADINAKNGKGDTPLHVACDANILEAVTLLLKHNADPKAESKWGDQSLHKAVKGRNLSIVRKLLDAGADVNCRGSSDYTPLHHACTGRNLSAALVDVLLKKGAELNALSSGDETPLYMSCKYRSTNQLEIIEALIEGGADPAIAAKRDAPIHRACVLGNPVIVSCLLKNGAPVNARDSKAKTPLHIATKMRSQSVVKVLLAAGADVKAVDQDQATALHIAVMRPGLDLLKYMQASKETKVSVPIVKQLIDAGAKPDAKAEGGKSPRDLIADIQKPNAQQAGIKMLFAGKDIRGVLASSLRAKAQAQKVGRFPCLPFDDKKGVTVMQHHAPLYSKKDPPKRFAVLYPGDEVKRGKRITTAEGKRYVDVILRAKIKGKKESVIVRMLEAEFTRKKSARTNTSSRTKKQPILLKRY